MEHSLSVKLGERSNLARRREEAAAAVREAQPRVEDVYKRQHEDADELLRYSRDLGAVATLPLRHEVVSRYGDVFKEVSGG